MERTGGCLCGSVRYRATLVNSEAGACHCGMCQKWTGSALVTVPTETVTFESTDGLRTFASSQWAERGFCSTCGTSLFYRLTIPGPHLGQTLLAMGSLDETAGIALTHEVFIDYRPGAYRFAGELQGMTEADVMAQFL